MRTHRMPITCTSKRTQLPGQRVVEVKLHTLPRSHLQHHTCKLALAVGRGKVHRITWARTAPSGRLGIRLLARVKPIAASRGCAHQTRRPQVQVKLRLSPSLQPRAFPSTAGANWPLPMVSVAGLPSKVLITMPCGPLMQ